MIRAWRARIPSLAASFQKEPDHVAGEPQARLPKPVQSLSDTSFQTLPGTIIFWNSCGKSPACPLRNSVMSGDALIATQSIRIAQFVDQLGFGILKGGNPIAR